MFDYNFNMTSLLNVGSVRVSNVYRLVMYLGSMWPVSLSERSTTFPFGIIEIHVIEAWFSEILSQPSGGNWRALEMRKNHTKQNNKLHNSAYILYFRIKTV